MFPAKAIAVGVALFLCLAVLTSVLLVYNGGTGQATEQAECCPAEECCPVEAQP